MLLTCTLELHRKSRNKHCCIAFLFKFYIIYFLILKDTETDGFIFYIFIYFHSWFLREISFFLFSFILQPGFERYWGAVVAVIVNGMVVGFTTTYAINGYHHCKWVRILIDMARCTTLCDQVCQWLATGLWFSSVLRFPPPIKLTAMI